MTASDVRMTKTVIARVPYLNCAPFFQGLILDESWEWEDVFPRQLGTEAEAGRIAAGPMALVDFLRLQDRFERISNLGVAVRGRSGSALLFSRKPIRQLDDAIIAVTDETSTTALLLRLILEVRYELSPKAYLLAPPLLPPFLLSQESAGVRGQAGQREGVDDTEAVLLIGDEALRFRSTNRRYPYENDLAFEWWLWQHLPFVFAVWTVRKDCEPEAKQGLSRTLFKTLAMNATRLDILTQECATSLNVPVDELREYLSNFIYRFGEPEERAIKQFEALAHEHSLL